MSTLIINYFIIWPSAKLVEFRMDFLRKVVGKLSYCCCRNSFFSKHWRNLDWQCTSIDSFKSTTFKLHQADINFDKLQVCLGIFLRKNTTATCSFLFLFPLPPCCSANLSASFLLLKSKLNHPVPVDLTLSLVCCHSWSKIKCFSGSKTATLWAKHGRCWHNISVAKEKSGGKMGKVVCLPWFGTKTTSVIHTKQFYLLHCEFYLLALWHLYCIVTFIYCVVTFIFCVVTFVFWVVTFIYCIVTFIYCVVTFIYCVVTFIFCVVTFIALWHLFFVLWLLFFVLWFLFFALWLLFFAVVSFILLLTLVGHRNQPCHGYEQFQILKTQITSNVWDQRVWHKFQQMYWDQRAWNKFQQMYPWDQKPCQKLQQMYGIKTAYQQLHKIYGMKQHVKTYKCMGWRERDTNYSKCIGSYQRVKNNSKWMGQNSVSQIYSVQQTAWHI